MDFLSSFFDGIYMGFISAFMPLSLILYCLYFTVRKCTNIGKYIFAGHFSILFILSALSFFGGDIILQSTIFTIAINVLSVILCVLFCINLTSKAIKMNNQHQYEEDPIDDSNDVQDIYSLRDDDSHDEENDNSDDDFEESSKLSTDFIAGILFTLFSSQAIAWACVSVKGSITKLYVSCGNGFSGIVGVAIFLASLVFFQFLSYMIISKIFLLIGKAISKSLMKPFIILVASLFAVLAVVNIVNIFFYVSEGVI